MLGKIINILVSEYTFRAILENLGAALENRAIFLKDKPESSRYARDAEVVAQAIKLLDAAIDREYEEATNGEAPTDR